MPIAGQTSQSEALSFSPILSECGDLSGMRRRLSARDIESFMRFAFILRQLLRVDLAGYGQDGI